MQALPWIKKYQPKTLAEVVGQQTPLEKLKEAVKKKEPVLLYGPPGIGKTSAVYALANDLDYELLELNASDVRNKDAILAIAGASAMQRSLFMKPKLFLVDELDGISGQEDRGGIQALLQIIKLRTLAIVIIANDPWEKQFFELRQACQLIAFNSLTYLSITSLLRTIAKQEQLAISDEHLAIVARRSGNDARAAINDLQLLASTLTTNNQLDPQSLETLAQRDKTEKLTDALMRVFKTTDFAVAFHAYDEIDEDYEKIMLLLDENLPKEYQGKALAKAYLALAKADIFSKRIRKRQDWRYLVYILFLLSVGIALAKEEKNRGFVQYQLTSERLKQTAIAKGAQAQKEELAKKLAARLHCSIKEARMHVLPYLELIIKKYKNDKQLRNLFMHELQLQEQDLAYLER
ncbi:MAG: replication factor C large subunit [Candidatus Woesearchaeota archaeon]